MSRKRTVTQPTMTRRAAISGLCAGAGALFGSTRRVRAQPTPRQSDGEAQITTNVVIPEVGQPFAGNYVGQFVIFTDPTPGDDVSPSVIAECDHVGWSPTDTKEFEVLILDRLRESPRYVKVPAYMNETTPMIRVGDVFMINRVLSCPGDFLTLELEKVPAESFNPEYGTVEHPLIGEPPGPTVSPQEDGADDDPGIVASPGQPGFGVLSLLATAGGIALVRRLVRQT